MTKTCSQDKAPIPAGPHAAYNHNSTNDANTFVFGYGAGQLFPDYYVHVILRGDTRKE